MMYTFLSQLMTEYLALCVASKITAEKIVFHLNFVYPILFKALVILSVVNSSFMQLYKNGACCKECNNEQQQMCL